MTNDFPEDASPATDPDSETAAHVHAAAAVEEAPEAPGESPGPQDAEPVAPLPVEVPELVDLNQLQARPLAELHREAVKAGLRVAGIRSKHQLVFELVSHYGRHGSRIEATGVLEYDGGNHGFLRWPEFSFAPMADDLFVPLPLIRRFGLRPGQLLHCTVKAPRDRDKFCAAGEVLSVEGIPADQWNPPKAFENLTALFPQERIILENPKRPSVSARIVDLVAPLGKGQRGLIVAPPRGGKTLLLKEIARSIRANDPEIELIVLLLDERPEEVTDFREAVDVPVYSSTFDEPSRRHIQVSEMVAHRAKRLVELGKDVVILLDSLTRLARGHNQSQGGMPGRGAGIMSGGLGAKALEKPRKFFGAARNVEEGGSLTILATALVETDSRMDEVIFEEFKGTGNMEIALDREMVEKRIFPAIHLNRSGTRNDEKLYHPDEFRRVTVLRRELAKLPAVEAMEVLIRNVKHTGSNAELLLKGLR
jgi:transcription termination factor Rho